MIIFIFGEDDFRSKEKVKQLKEKFLRDVDPSGNSLVVIRGNEASIKEINEKCGASSLFCSKRMVVVEDLFSNTPVLEQAVDYFRDKEEKGSEDIVVFQDSRIKTKRKKGQKTPLFLDDSGREKTLNKKAQKLFDFLSSQQYVQEFASLSDPEAVQWIQNRVDSRGGKISNKNAQLLLGMTGGDLWQLHWEIEKLIHYKQGQISSLQVEIEARDIEAVTTGLFNQDIFALTDAVGSKNPGLALRLLEEQLLSGVSEHFLLNMIIRQVKILLQIRQALDSGYGSGQIAGQVKLHPFVVQKSISQVRGFSLDRLKKALNRLVEIDSELKTGQGEAKSMLDLFLLKLSS